MTEVANEPQMTELRMMSWNVRAGGFTDHNPSENTPPYEAAIADFITSRHMGFNVSSVSLIDTYRWTEIYDTDEKLAQHLGYTAARAVDLDDERLNATHGTGIGVAFATDLPIQESKPLDLYTRQGLGVILDIGTYGLQIATVYLDDLSEETRLTNIRALEAALEPDVPTLVVGDFNALRPDVSQAGMNVRLRDLLIRAAARVLPKRTALGETIAGMNERRAVPLLESYGFIDAACQPLPTAPALFPCFGIDYVFSKDVPVKDVTVLPRAGGSDHLAIEYTTLVQGAELRTSDIPEQKQEALVSED